MTTKLTEKESKTIESGHCPDCDSVYFLHGPAGGMSENIRCKHCGKEFCFSPFPGGTDRIDRDCPEYYGGQFDLRKSVDSPYMNTEENPWPLSGRWWKKLLRLN